MEGGRTEREISRFFFNLATLTSSLCAEKSIETLHFLRQFKLFLRGCSVTRELTTASCAQVANWNVCRIQCHLAKTSHLTSLCCTDSSVLALQPYTSSQPCKLEELKREERVQQQAMGEHKPENQRDRQQGLYNNGKVDKLRREKGIGVCNQLPLSVFSLDHVQCHILQSKISGFICCARKSTVWS